MSLLKSGFLTSGVYSMSDPINKFDWIQINMDKMQKHKMVIHPEYGKGIILLREEYQDNFMVNFYDMRFYPNVKSVYWQDLDYYYPNYNEMWQEVND